MRNKKTKKGALFKQIYKLSPVTLIIPKTTKMQQQYYLLKRKMKFVMLASYEEQLNRTPRKASHL